MAAPSPPLAAGFSALGSAGRGDAEPLGHGAGRGLCCCCCHRDGARRVAGGWLPPPPHGSVTPWVPHPIDRPPRGSATPRLHHPKDPSPLPPSPLPPLILAPRSCSPPFPHAAGVLGSPHPMSDPPRAQHPSPPQDPVTMSWSRPSTPHPSVPPPDTTSSTQPASPGCTVSPPPACGVRDSTWGPHPTVGLPRSLGGCGEGAPCKVSPSASPKGTGGSPSGVQWPG